MSLTSLLGGDASVKAAFQVVKRPVGLAMLPIAAFPLSRSPAMIGTAFDYALRFGLEARGWAAHDHWIADSAIVRALTTPELQPLVGLALMQQAEAKRLIEVAGEALTCGELSAGAARACTLLAGVDILQRAPSYAGAALMRPLEDADVLDLQALYRIVPWKRFQPTTVLHLNPTFREGSLAVGGADADLIVDDCLIEIKTTKTSKIELSHLRQLVGYALLANQFGVDEKGGQSVTIRRLGVYLSRAGVLVSWPLEECVSEKEQGRLLDALLARGRAQWRRE
ncbi:hypothetical protein KKF91_01000 [Myxococcota bacterium]|nr:hypothetical protein [Myxococcota bacterium]